MPPTRRPGPIGRQVGLGFDDPRDTAVPRHHARHGHAYASKQARPAGRAADSRDPSPSAERTPIRDRTVRGGDPGEVLRGEPSPPQDPTEHGVLHRAVVVEVRRPAAASRSTAACASRSASSARRVSPTARWLRRASDPATTTYVLLAGSARASRRPRVRGCLPRQTPGTRSTPALGPPQRRRCRTTTSTSITGFAASPGTSVLPRARSRAPRHPGLERRCVRVPELREPDAPQRPVLDDLDVPHTSTVASRPDNSPADSILGENHSQKG